MSSKYNVIKSSWRNNLYWSELFKICKVSPLNYFYLILNVSSDFTSSWNSFSHSLYEYLLIVPFECQALCSSIEIKCLGNNWTYTYELWNVAVIILYYGCDFVHIYVSLSLSLLTIHITPPLRMTQDTRIRKSPSYVRNVKT